MPVSQKIKTQNITLGFQSKFLKSNFKFKKSNFSYPVIIIIIIIIIIYK